MSFSGRCQQEAYTASEKIDRSEPDLVRYNFDIHYIVITLSIRPVFLFFSRSNIFFLFFIETTDHNDFIFCQLLYKYNYKCSPRKKLENCYRTK